MDMNHSLPGEGPSDMEVGEDTIPNDNMKAESPLNSDDHPFQNPHHPIHDAKHPLHNPHHSFHHPSHPLHHQMVEGSVKEEAGETPAEEKHEKEMGTEKPMKKESRTDKASKWAGKMK